MPIVWAWKISFFSTKPPSSNNANLSNLEYIRKIVGIPNPIVQTIEPETEKEDEIIIEDETNDGEISDDKVRLTYTKNS